MPYIHIFKALTETVTAFAASGGYAALFAVLLLEGLPLVGVAIPGHVAIISAGFLASTGVMNVYLSLAVGIAGAVFGDVVSYWLGVRYGWPLIEKMRPYFFISEKTIAKARSFLEAHTGKALFLGRFNPVTRGLMPFFVGSNHMSPRRFLIWNSLGVVAWVGVSVALGYAIGLGYHVATGWISRVATLTIIAIILIVWSYRFVNARFHVFRRYELFALGLNIASTIVLFRMIADAFAPQPFMLSFDVWVNTDLVGYFIESLGTWLITAASWGSALGGTIVVSVATVLLGIYFAARAKWRSAAITLVSVGFTALSTAWLKELVMRIRPADIITPDVTNALRFLFDGGPLKDDPSFPSAHAAFAAALLVAIAYLFAPKMKSWVSRELFIVACVVAAIGVGVSRLILSAHWASDVIGGWALGVFSATAAILFVRYVGALIEGKIQQDV